MAELSIKYPTLDKLRQACQEARRDWSCCSRKITPLRPLASPEALGRIRLPAGVRCRSGVRCGTTPGSTSAVPNPDQYDQKRPCDDQYDQKIATHSG